MAVIRCCVTNLFCLTVLLFGKHVHGGAGNEWRYDGNLGPTHWHIDYPVCGGHKQSPININTEQVILNKSLSSFVLTGYQNITNVNMSIQNNGHTVEIDLSGEPITLSGGGLPGTYKALQFHFHWGSKSNRGSEHLINQNHFPMEMHIVHYSTRYRSFSSAMNVTDGLAVLGFFFKMGSRNPYMDKIINHFAQISHKNDHVKIATFSLHSLLPDDLVTYYRYYGSLTTPPCFESIIWTMFTKPIEISENQMNRFRTALHSNAHNQADRSESDDFRPVQQLNGRVVYASKQSAIYKVSKAVPLYSLMNLMILCFPLLVVSLTVY